MFSKSLFLAAGLLSASAAFSLPSKPVPGDPAIIPLPSCLLYTSPSPRDTR